MTAIPFAPSWLLSLLLIVFHSIGLSGVIIEGKLDDQISNIFTHESAESKFHQEASPTVAVNLPIIENNGPESNPALLENYPAPESSTEVPPGTPTPTPIPVQTGSANVPIVLGALAIITVVLLGWFFVGYLPSRKQGEPS